MNFLRYIVKTNDSVNGKSKRQRTFADDIGLRSSVVKCENLSSFNGGLWSVSFSIVKGIYWEVFECINCEWSQSRLLPGVKKLPMSTRCELVGDERIPENI